MNLLDSSARCEACKDLLRLMVNKWVIDVPNSRLLGASCPNGHEFSEDDLKEALRKLG